MLVCQENELICSMVIKKCKLKEPRGGGWKLRETSMHVEYITHVILLGVEKNIKDEWSNL